MQRLIERPQAEEDHHKTADDENPFVTSSGRKIADEDVVHQGSSPEKTSSYSHDGDDLREDSSHQQSTTPRA